MTKKEKEIIKRLKDTFSEDMEKITFYEDGIAEIRKALNLIDKLQKENEELHKEIERQGNAREIEEEYIEKKFISKDKIREKINELEYFYKKEVKPIMYQWTDFTAEEHYKELIHNLKELLEEKRE